MKQGWLAPPRPSSPPSSSSTLSSTSYPASSLPPWPLQEAHPSVMQSSRTRSGRGRGDLGSVLLYMGGITMTKLTIQAQAEAILLGFQHYLVMVGTIVILPTALDPQLGGNNEDKIVVMQTLLFVAGINTLLQSFFGTRLPAVIGGSYTFVLPTISIILAGCYANGPDPHTLC